MLKNWIEVELGDICDVVSGKNQKNVENPNGKYPIYGSGGIFGYADDYLCESGTTIIGRKGTINSPIYVNQKFWNVDTAFGISPLNNIDSKYIHYLCVGFDFKKLDKSTTIPSLAKRDIVKIKFPLAPLPEQRAIAAKIEQLFSELDNGIANLKTAKSKLEIYRQAILKQAFEGELTKDWRKKQPKNHGNHVNQKNHSTDNLPETWKWLKLEDLAIVGTGATPKRGDSNYWLNGSIAWITSGALNDLYVKEASEFITEAAIKETNCKIFPKGSLLIAMYGEGKTRGKCSELMISAATNQAIASIEINDEFKEYKKYIKWFLLKNYDDIRMLSSGGVQPNLNLTIVKNTKLPFCPIEEQTQIVQEIETRLSVCDKLNEAIEQSLEKAQALRQSILKKAFEGKLLSQDELETCRQQPDWEPAAKLLERVKNKKNK